jgi:hypothetical protein
MPYVKCVPCKIRVRVTGTRVDPADPSCPGCGFSLEPVAQLTEVMGFRSELPFDESIPARLAEEIALELPPRT